MQQVAPASDRPFCNEVQQQTSLICVTSAGPPGLGSRCTQPAMGGSGSICLPISGHLGQNGGEVAGLPMQENHSDCSGVAQHALVLISTGHVQANPIEPAQPALPFNKIPHRNLSNLSLHAWLLEPQQSRSRAFLRQWQHDLRFLREDQPDLFIRQSGPFLQSGASVIRWTSGHPLQVSS